MRAALGHVTTGLGIELLPTDNLSIGVGVDNRYYLTDRLDHIKLGKYNDSFWSFKASVVFYFGRTTAPVAHRAP